MTGNASSQVQAPHQGDKDVVDYWDGRSTSYSVSVCEELGSPQCAAWDETLRSCVADAATEHIAAGNPPEALDLGCGPGFFAILLARMGCDVTSMDASEGMLAQAQANVRGAGVADRVRFVHGDVARLPFADCSFDVIALRNVTWLMEDPTAAYAEWLRVLRPGGKLVVFDANWYRYLSDLDLAARRAADQADVATLGKEADARATDGQIDQCEHLASWLPFTHMDRPRWELDHLYGIGYSDVSVDTTVASKLWTEGEQAFHGSTPLFMIQATK